MIGRTETNKQIGYGTTSMQIALISDVHANAPALRAVLNDMPPVDDIVHAGDVVGYGAFPKEVIDTFRKKRIKSIQGNHEQGILFDFPDGHPIPEKSADWTLDYLDSEELSYLAGLPLERDLLDGQIYVNHGAPGSTRTYTYPEDFESTLLGEEEVLVLGHTHVQAASSFEEGTIVNPGSVGLPRDGDPRAAYAILDCDDWNVNLRRVEYDVERAQEAIRDQGLPEELVDGLEEGELIFGRTKTAHEATNNR